MKNEFPGFKTREVSIIENPEMKGFEIALKNKETEITVIISTDGTVLKIESSDENKEETVNKNEEENKINTENNSFKVVRTTILGKLVWRFAI